ncbi:MAG: HEAT repeat domain-containing protein [Anaerolineae bacterium]|nr:HEAT repeat domain-containing protein [Anaerolineae bacterium]
MDIFNLTNRLRDPDPRVRVETLRILAMIEETRALPAVHWIYKHDPEPGVRAVADWAGDLLWQAHKRGHSTADAVNEMFERSVSSARQEQFLETLEVDLLQMKNIAAQRFVAEQDYRRKMSEALQVPAPEETDSFATDEALPQLPARVDPSTAPERRSTDSWQRAVDDEWPDWIEG